MGLNINSLLWNFNKIKCNRIWTYRSWNTNIKRVNNYKFTKNAHLLLFLKSTKNEVEHKYI